MNSLHILASGSAAPTIISTMNFYGRRWSAVSPLADHGPTMHRPNSHPSPIPPYARTRARGYARRLEGSGYPPGMILIGKESRPPRSRIYLFINKVDLLRDLCGPALDRAGDE
jgi:hypothetical protein